MQETVKNPPANKADSSLVSFTSAFALGALLSYFATPAGKSTWRKLAAEWEKAKKELYAQGLIPDVNISLDEFKDQYLSQVNQSFHQLKESCEGFLQQAETLLQEKKMAKKQKRKFKFKGVK